MRIPNSERDVLASKLRRCYQYERNYLSCRMRRPANYRVPACWDGGNVKKKVTVWHKLAAFCEKRQIDPIHYIQWCLDINQVALHPPPEPNQLLSSRRMDAYRDYQDKQREVIRIQLQNEKNAVERTFGYHRSFETKSKDAWACTLCNGSIGVSPLFRYVLALGIGGERFRKIAHCCEQDALFQYQRNPAAYDAYLGPLVVVLPSDFAERAAALYDQLLEQDP